MTAFVTGFFQIADPKEAAQASPPSTITQSVTVTTTAASGSTHLSTSSPGEDPDPRTSMQVSGGEESLLHKQPKGGRDYEIGSTKINGERYPKSMSQVHTCLSSSYYQNVYEIDKKYTKFRAQVALGGESEHDAAGEFAVSFGDGEAKVVFVDYGNDPTYLELDLAREPGEPSILRISARCKEGTYSDAQLVWANPIIAP